MKKLLAALMLGMFTLSTATAVIAADGAKKDEKKEEKKAEKK